MKATVFWAAIAATSLALAAAGCDPVGGPTLEKRLVSDNPRERVGAVRELADSQDPESDIRLIHLLADQDEGVRFFAAAALHRRTEKRFDYQAEAPLRQREAAIARWIEWYCQEHPEAGPKFEGLLASMKTLDQSAPPTSEEGPSS
ncbi:MAG: HEAT repeat domain-containing protein [Planctomycetes bacterium]|nr:HEAT repeat domain-containing protein [Planctomycetota bacterium]